MVKYKVYDFYDFSIVALCKTLREARKAYKEWFRDTDGECDLVIFKWNKEEHEYQAI